MSEASLSGTFTVPTEGAEWILGHLRRESEYRDSNGKQGLDLTSGRFSSFHITKDLRLLRRTDIKSAAWRLHYLVFTYNTNNKEANLTYDRPSGIAKKIIFMQSLQRAFYTNFKKKEKNSLMIKIIRSDLEEAKRMFPPLSPSVNKSSNPLCSTDTSHYFPKHESTQNCLLQSPNKNMKENSTSTPSRSKNKLIRKKRQNTIDENDVPSQNILLWIQNSKQRSTEPSSLKSQRNNNTESPLNNIRQSDAAPTIIDLTKDNIATHIPLIKRTSTLAKAQAKRQKAIKIKQENIGKGNFTSLHAPYIEDRFTTQPKCPKEWGMINQLRSMGFTDRKEILSGIRATEDLGRGLYSHDHAEAAMMWIINQREEAEEARKIDAVRISSEIYVEEIYHKKEIEMSKATAEEILGNRSKNSKFFPHSILLQSQIIQKVCKFFMENERPRKSAKSELLEYLKLEKKARQWYGFVLPYSYFYYEIRTIFEKWNDKLPKITQPSSSIEKFCFHCASEIRDQRIKLEHAMFSLSEQVEGGLGNVPKLFVDAREDAKAKGLPDLPPHTDVNKSNIIQISDDDTILSSKMSTLTTEPSKKRRRIQNNFTGHNQRNSSQLNHEIIEIL